MADDTKITRRSGITEMRKRIAVLRTRLERLLLWRVWERMLEIEFIDRSVALAGKVFVSFFPLVVVVAAFAPERIRSSILTTVTARLGIRGDALVLARDAFASADDIRKATGVLGLVLTIFFATSFTTALQRLYLRAWRRPSRATGVGAYWRGATWLLVMLVCLALLGGLRGALGGGLGFGLFAIVSLALMSGLWWFTAWFLLLGEVRARVLIPPGVITSIATAGYAASATAWMPGVVTSNEAQFGLFGIALASVSPSRRRHLHLGRGVRRTGLGRGHRASRQADPRRRDGDTDRRGAPAAPVTRPRSQPSRRLPQHPRPMTAAESTCASTTGVTNEVNDSLMPASIRPCVPLLRRRVEGPARFEVRRRSESGSGPGWALFQPSPALDRLRRRLRGRRR